MVRFRAWRKLSKRAWYHVHFTSAQLDAREDARFRLQFDRVYRQLHRPPGLSLWMARHAGSGADFYMSPKSRTAASELICSSDAQACYAPFQPLVCIAGQGRASVDADSIRSALKRIFSVQRSALDSGFVGRSLRHVDNWALRTLLAHIFYSTVLLRRRFVQTWCRLASALRREKKA